jgi:hypothetical protein
MRWVEYIACMLRKEIHAKFNRKNRRRETILEDLVADRNALL